MTRGLLRTPVLFFGILALSVCTAQAQSINSPYRFLEGTQFGGPFAGYIKASAGASGLGHEDAATFGVNYGLRLSGPLMLDVNALYFPSKYAVLDTAVTKTSSDSSYKRIGTANSSLAGATASLRLNLTGARTWHSILPYVQGGAGLVVEVSKDKTAIEKAPIDARHAFGTSFAATFGAGFELFPTKRLAIRVDGRNVLWKIKTPAALSTGRLARLTPESEYVNNLALTAGVNLHF